MESRPKVSKTGPMNILGGQSQIMSLAPMVTEEFSSSDAEPALESDFCSSFAERTLWMNNEQCV